MIQIALLEKFGCKALISRFEVRSMIADSSKPRKLGNVYTIKRTARKVSVQTAYDMFSKYKYIIVNLVFPTSIFGVGIFF